MRITRQLKVPNKIVTDRFWKFVDKRSNEECWNWLGFIHKRGYGKFCIEGTCRSANRVSWTICKGKIPKNMLVAHKCDNRKCVNPNHLFIADDKINTLDMIAKKRANVWGKVDDSILTFEKAELIRKLYQRDINGYKRLGKQFGVHWSTIRAVIKKRSWNFDWMPKDKKMPASQVRE